MKICCQISKIGKSAFMATSLATLSLIGAGGWGAMAHAEMSGELGISAGGMRYSQSDDSENNSLLSYGINGHVRFMTGPWEFKLDGSWLQHKDDRGDFDQYAPWGVGSYGIHAGRNFGPGYVGIFGGGNSFQGIDASSINGYVTGTLYGVEARYAPSSIAGLTVFGQVGHADMVGESGDTAFNGNFYRVGAQAASGAYAFMLAYEHGRSSNIFEDLGDWGEYDLVTAEGRYKAGRFIYAVGAEHGVFTANTEDNGSSTRLYAKIIIPFGEAPKANLLKTPYGPGLAAAWAEVLD